MFSKNLQLSYYKKNFQPQKFSLYISEILNNKSRVSWSLFIKHNFIKSETYFNATHIYSIFSRIHVFQGPSFFGFMYFRVQVFKGPRLSGCRSRVKVQVLEVALCIDMEITLRHRCSPVNFLLISEHLFMRIPLKDCLCMFKL